MIRVLYVDDEPLLLDILREVLSEEPDIEVQVSDSAVGSLRSGIDVDVVISDYQMPAMDGIEFLREVRAHSDVPFILFTGRGREEVVISAFNEGADAYVQKGTDTAAQFRELIHHVRQLHKRRCAESALRQSERMSQAMMQNSNGIVVKIAPEGIVESVNDFGLQRTGQDLEDAIGTDAVAVLSPAPGWNDVLRDTLRDEGTDGMVLHDLDLGPRWVKWSVRRLGEASGVVALGTDVTDLIDAERRLERSQAHYKGLVDTCVGIVIQTDLDMAISFINPSGAEIVGSSEWELVGRDVLSTFLTDVEGEMPSMETMIDGPCDAVVSHVRDRNGVTRWISWSIGCLRDVEGRATGFVMNGTDITDMRRAQDVLFNMNAVLDAFNEVGRMTTHITSRREMMDSIVKRFADVHGFRSALIMVGSETSYEVSHVMRGVVNPSFLNGIRRGVLPSVARDALSSDRVVVTESPSIRCVDCRISDVCGGDVSMSCRLEYEGRVHGLLTISMDRDISRLPDMGMMFQRASDDIGIALSHLEAEEERASHLENVEMYERIMDSLRNPVSIVNRDYTYRIVNEEYERLFNRSKGNLIGKTVADLVGEATFERKVRRHIDRALSGHDVQYEDWIEFPSCGLVPIKMMYSPLLDVDGEVEGVVVIGMVMGPSAAGDEVLIVSEDAHRISDGEGIPGVTVTTSFEAYEDRVMNGQFDRVVDLVKGRVLEGGRWFDLEDDARRCVGRLTEELLGLIIRTRDASSFHRLLSMTSRPAAIVERSAVRDEYAIVAMNALTKGLMTDGPIRVEDGAIWTMLEAARKAGRTQYSPSHLDTYLGDEDGFQVFPLTNFSMLIMVGRIEGYECSNKSAIVNEAIVEIGDVLMDRSHDIGTLTRTILDRSRAITGSEHGFVSTIDPVTGSNLGHTLTEMMGDSCKLTGKDSRIVFPRGDDGMFRGLYGHPLNTGEPFYVNSPQSHPSSIGTPHGHIPLRNFLSVPAMDGDEVIGQIALSNKDGDYDDDDLRAVEKLAETYSLALRLRTSEQSLRESKDMFTNVFDEVDMGMALLNLDGRYVKVNRALRRMSGFTDEEFLSMDSLTSVHPEDREHGRTLLKMMREGISDCVSMDLRGICKDGREIDLLMRSSIIRDPHGEPSYIVATMQDMTLYKEGLQRLEVLNTKLDLLGKMTRHDVINQLTAIRAYIHLSKDGLDKGSLDKAERGLENIRSILAFGRDYESLGKEEPMWMDVGSSFERGTSTVDTGDVDIVVDVDGMKVWADKMLEKVFHNLVDNSIRHGGDVSRISLGVEDGHRIVYEDDGNGMSDLIRSTLFDPSRRHGMTMARSILELTGITIEEVGSLGSGARFVIDVPENGIRTGGPNSS